MIHRNHQPSSKSAHRQLQIALASSPSLSDSLLATTDCRAKITYCLFLPSDHFSIQQSLAHSLSHSPPEAQHPCYAFRFTVRYPDIRTQQSNRRLRGHRYWPRSVLCRGYGIYSEFLFNGTEVYNCNADCALNHLHVHLDATPQTWAFHSTMKRRSLYGCGGIGVPARRHSTAKKFTHAVEACTSVKNLERHLEEALLAVGEKDLAVLRHRASRRCRASTAAVALVSERSAVSAAYKGTEICIGNADSALLTRFFTLPRRDTPKLLVRGKVFGEEAKIS
jgi:hypothetical protein